MFPPNKYPRKLAFSARKKAAAFRRGFDLFLFNHKLQIIVVNTEFFDQFLHR